LADRTKLWNPPEAVLANLNKRYLLELAEQGVDVVPTRILHRGQQHLLRQVLEESGWDDVVVKPEVSAGAHLTWRTNLASADAEQNTFARQLLAHDLLIQPFLAEVAERGEWSIMFFAGEYSHAVLKRPADGDFRVQQHLGGSTVSAQPPPDFIDQAHEILSKVDSNLMYARVDGVDRNGRLVLMELEINEPYLFLGYSPGAAQRLAAAIMAVI
jgi:glutathione synthase/RimK-type ligase-like ATP-grasp enzyme